MGFVVDLTGMDKIQKALQNLETNLKVEVSNEINASALNIQSNAKRLAPVNFGQLRNGIALIKNSDLTFTVESKASYSPYVEFGTGGKVSVPADFTAYAKQFKGGKGGKFKGMVDALMLWGIRKGYIEQGKGARTHAYFMAKKILQRGLRPQPFLIPSYQEEKPKLIQRLKKLLDA